MKSLYRRHRFPSEIISHAIWPYHRFTLSFRDVEDLCRTRGLGVLRSDLILVQQVWTVIRPHASEATGPTWGIWHVDELFIMICGERHYLWRAVDQDGDVLDILVTRPRDKRAAKRFFHKVLKHQGQPLLALVTDKLRSYAAAHRDVFPSATHRTGPYENNRAEVSHQHTRERERHMRWFKISGPSPALSLSSQPYSQPLPSRKSSSQSDLPPTSPAASFHGLEEGDVCLLKGRTPRWTSGQPSLGVINLTMPPDNRFQRMAESAVGDHAISLAST